MLLFCTLKQLFSSTLNCSHKLVKMLSAHSIPSLLQPLPSLSVSNLSFQASRLLRSRASLNQLGAGERCKLPQRGPGPGTEQRSKKNLVHSRAVRKPLVAIILSILKCMFYTV